MLSIDQVYKNVIQNKFTYVKIFDSDTSDAIGIFYGLNNKAAKPSEVNSYIKEFVNQQPGIYTFEFKRYATAKNSSAIRYKKVNCLGTDHHIHIDEGKEREAIRKRIEEEEREKLSKINYDEKVKELDTVAGMLSHIVKEVFVHFKTKNTPTGNLQGMSQTSYDPVAPEKFTPEQIKMANEGLAKLMKVMSPELFYQIACKLEQNPDKVSAIKTFL